MATIVKKWHVVILILLLALSLNAAPILANGPTKESKTANNDLEIIDNIEKCIVQIFAGQGKSSLRPRGTGFFVSEDGVFITAAHVITEKSTGQFYPAVVCSYGKKAFPVHLIAKDLVIDYNGHPLEYDAVVCKVRNMNKVRFPCLKIGNSLEAKMGDEVYILGYALSGIFYKGQKMLKRIDVASRRTPYLKKGCIGAVMRIHYSKDSRKTFLENFYVIDSYSVGGLSGSPIYHLKTGSVIGVVSGSPVTSADLGGGKKITYPSGILEVAPINYVKYLLMKKNFVEKDEIWESFNRLLKPQKPENQ